MTVPLLLCTRSGCSAPAARALMNEFGWVHLECPGHLSPGSPWPGPDASRLLRAEGDVLLALRAAGGRPRGLRDGTRTVVVPLELVLALSVMGT